MYIETTRHNIYSYLRRTGEIVPGAVADDNYVWSFTPLKPFSDMPEVDMFILSITEQCNLRCTYCCYSGEYEGNRSHSSRAMNRSDIDAILDFIQKMSSKRPLYISFYGGEPLIHYTLVQYAILNAEKRWDGDVLFSITTNATLLTEDRVDWLVAHHVKLEISIDGTAPFHDHHRIDLDGHGSFSRMYRALSYLAIHYPEYLSNIQLLMTLPSIELLPSIAEDWHNDAVLGSIAPSHITSVAPNFAKGVAKRNYEMLKNQHLKLLDIYEQHPDWLVLKAYFNECIAEWKNRPILDVGQSVPMSTCMPKNTKLYIDAEKQIAVCEKISDHYRIGNIRDGIDWSKANEQVMAYYNMRVHRCAYCPAIRMCNLCLTAVEYNEKQWDLLCHNERVCAQLDMLLFCEMAERGMVE